jgi:hypothetical protein
MIGFPYAIYRLLILGGYIWDRVGTFRKISWCVTITLCSMMTLINFFWYFLILKGLLKLLGIIKSTPRKPKVAEKKD